MVQLLKWLHKHRLQVCLHLNENNPPCKPDLAWWLMVYLLKDFAITVSLACKSLQGLGTLVLFQDQVLENLSNCLRHDGCVKGPMLNIAPVESDSDTYVNRHYYSRTVDAEEVVMNNELFVQESMEKIRLEAPDKYNDIIANIQILYVDAVMGIKSINVERDCRNGGTSTLPPVLPKGLLNVTRAYFGNLLAHQRIRLQNKLSKEEMLALEQDFKAFKDKTFLETGFRKQIEAMN